MDGSMAMVLGIIAVAYKLSEISKMTDSGSCSSFYMFCKLLRTQFNHYRLLPVFHSFPSYSL